MKAIKDQITSMLRILPGVEKKKRPLDNYGQMLWIAAHRREMWTATHPMMRFQDSVMFRDGKIKQEREKILYIFQLTKLYLISVQGAGSMFG